jgi:hypothetical protein
MASLEDKTNSSSRKWPLYCGINATSSSLADLCHDCLCHTISVPAAHYATKVNFSAAPGDGYRFHRAAGRVLQMSQIVYPCAVPPFPAPCKSEARHVYFPIATRYALEDPGIESRWGRLFSAPWVPPSLLSNGYRVFPGGKAAVALALTTHRHLVPKLKNG